jgi:hypothetical protein
MATAITFQKLERLAKRAAGAIARTMGKCRRMKNPDLAKFHRYVEFVEGCEKSAIRVMADDARWLSIRRFADLPMPNGIVAAKATVKGVTVRVAAGYGAPWELELANMRMDYAGSKRH